MADWKAKKEASLHAVGEDLGQAQEEEEEENIYAVPPEMDVRGHCTDNFVFDILPCSMQKSETSERVTCSVCQIILVCVPLELKTSSVSNIMHAVSYVTVF